MAPALTPAQEAVRRDLLDLGGARPTFRDGLARELHNRIADATAAVAERLELTGRTLWISKRTLAGVHGCERRFEAEEAAGFGGWSPALARGTVAHRAIQLGPFLPAPKPPLDLVRMAIDRIVEDGDDRSPAQWLKNASPAEMADVRAAATEVVTKFEDTFPPLVAVWRPRVETPIRHEFHKGVVTLGAKPDLALGKADGHTARVLIVDLKTGQRYGRDADDLRFYALVEALRLGVPPFRVATFYLDTARWEAEDVTEDVLEIAVRRTVDGIVKLAELQMGERVAGYAPGPACNFCVAKHGCEGAEEWARTEADPTS